MVNRNAVRGSWDPVVDDGASTPDGGVLEVGTRCRPWAGLDGAGDDEPIGNHGVEADFASVALGNGVGGNQTECAVLLQE